MRVWAPWCAFVILLSLAAGNASGAKLAAASPKKGTITGYFRDFVAKDKAYSYLSDPELTFPIKDEKNGYLTVAGKFDGALAFVLFRGRGKDLVVFESSECGPGCRYAYTALIFENGKFARRESLAKYYPAAELAKRSRALVAKTEGRSALPNGWPAEGDIRFILPKEGMKTAVYVAAPMVSTKYDETYFEVGSLAWDAARFRFTYSPAKTAKDLGPLDLY